MKQSWKLSILLVLLIFLVSACGTVAKNDIDTSSQSDEEALPPTSILQPTNKEEDIPITSDVQLLAPDEPPPAGAESQFITDFSIHTISYSEVLSGGPPKDGIPSIDEPNFISVQSADEWLDDVEPVILVQVGDDARAYPIQILIWHEIVNDVIDGMPVAITFCPLCNTAIAFDATLDGQVLDFGTTGRLRYSNLLMYDRPTETWWTQATGEAVVGVLTGKQLNFLPAPIISWKDFKTGHPDGLVLSRDTGSPRSYGNNPYSGYDDINLSPFLFRGPETPGVLPAMARVFTVNMNSDLVAYPYELLQSVSVINDDVGGHQVVVFWDEGTASPFSPLGSNDVGAANIFSRELDGQTLNFTFADGEIIDLETLSVWNVLGLAVSGELQGQHLTPLVGVNHFWFSWAAFQPDTRVYQLPE
ncbi:MAG: DUF3179 domain-containing protein [Chloroflexi bacterium]|nr:DUF3179 domain-containing protein [Chloroflexota bacterium]